MIFVDANVFLRALVRPSDEQVQRMHDAAVALFRRAEKGEIELTTSDAVIAEVAFILTSKAHYHLDPDDAAGRLAAMLRLRGLRMPQKRILLRALDLWTTYPALGFVDVLTASYSQQAGIELATFDAHFDRFTDIARWQL